jgi:multidrug efflux system outer membrane protein
MAFGNYRIGQPARSWLSFSKEAPMKDALVSLILGLMLAGCMVGPDYHPPQPTVCETWTSDSVVPNDSVAISQAPPAAWWHVFCDPLLEKYIDMAAFHNQNLMAAEAHICEARALRTVTAAPLYPQVNADLNAIRTYFSENGPLLAQTPGMPAPPTEAPFEVESPNRLQTIYTAIFDAIWEIDLFGRTRRAVEAANAHIGYAIEQRNDLLVSILAEVALNYVQLRSNQMRGKLIEENISILEKNAAVVTKQFQVGYRNQLDVQRVDAELSQAVAALPDILAQIYQNIYALSVLTGHVPEALLVELLPVQALPSLPFCVNMGIRSDLLRRRPDVRQAERQLAASTANIGVAVASFFPRLFLFGDIGLQSLNLKNLFEARSLTWTLLGDLHIPIFQGGRLIGNLRANEAAATAAAYTYQQAVLTALEEAESGLVAYSEELRTTENLKEAAFKYKRLIELTNIRFNKGLVNVTDLLDIERQNNAVQQNLLSSETAALIDLIKLYKALGGGWEPADACL